jgi:hypothetical protein
LRKEAVVSEDIRAHLEINLNPTLSIIAVYMNFSPLKTV